MPYREQERTHTDRSHSTHVGAGRALLSAALLASAVVQATGVPGPIVLREQLNQTHGPQLVSVPFRADDGSCVVDGVQLTGPDGPVAAQLADIERWPGDGEFVKSARLWFVVDGLAPLTSTTYTTAPGKRTAPAVPTDLHVAAAKDNVEITTAHVGVRLPLGGASFPRPVAASGVPGPLLAMRLGDAAWTGGSSVTGGVGVTEWASRLTDNGPVFARVETTYVFADSNTLAFSATVAAGDSAVRWTMSAQRDSQGAGVVWRLPPVPGVKQAVLPRGYGQWSRQDRQVAIGPGTAAIGTLSPDSSIVGAFPEHFGEAQFAGGKGQELRLASMNPGAWVEPIPMTYAGFEIWELDNIPKTWDAWKRQCMPMSCDAPSGAVTLSAPLTRGRREWMVSAGAPRLGDELDKIKDMALSWPTDSDRPHPRLFVGMQELTEVWARAAPDSALMKVLTSRGGWATPVVPLLMHPADQRKPEAVEGVIKPLRDQLARMGRFDVMRGAIPTVTLYDVLIGSDLLTPADKELFRAQMAYLGYVLASPQCWSMERGFISGNPNMSCSYTLSLGVIACALSDHPAAKGWAERATRWMDKWLTDEVGTNGEWMPEGSHYSYVSLEPMISYAIAAKRAGYHDFSDDPRFKKLLLYFAKFNTPRDPQRRTVNGVMGDTGLRSIGAYGRGHGGCSPTFGCVAPFFKTTAPDFAAQMQWIWNESGSPVYMGDGRLGGLEPYYQDHRLPAVAPDWGSELFPGIAALLRAGFNTENESFLIALASAQSLRNLDMWTPEVGGIAQWFGRGKPLSTCFTFEIGYKERHELLRNGVRLARNWGAPGDPEMPFGHYTETRFGAFASLPPADYVRSTFVNTRIDDRNWFPPKVPAFPKVKPAQGANLDWTRQLLFVRDPDAAGPAWIALRDTVDGGQPTAWQFWTLSEKLGTPEQASDADAFLADSPGQTNLPARALPPGDRYTALGQFGMDVEYFVVSPAKTPRHTLRYGGMWAGNRIPEYQDLLHLQLPGDGAYCVAVYPRPRAEAPPVFTALAGGAVIKAAGAFGTDYAFLSLDVAEAYAEVASFRGTAGVAQKRAESTLLTLPAKGSVALGDYALSAPIAVSLRAEQGALALRFADNHPGGEVTVGAPGTWQPSAGSAVPARPNDKGQWVLTVPAGISAARLVKGP